MPRNSFDFMRLFALLSSAKPLFGGTLSAASEKTRLAVLRAFIRFSPENLFLLG